VKFSELFCDSLLTGKNSGCDALFFKATGTFGMSVLEGAKSPRFSTLRTDESLRTSLVHSEICIVQTAEILCISSLHKAELSSVFALKGVLSAGTSTVLSSETHRTSAMHVLVSLINGLLAATELLLVSLLEEVAPFCSLELDGVDILCTNFLEGVPTCCVCLLEAVCDSLIEGDDPLRTCLLQGVGPL
jgi:hypothetical protein